MFWRSRVPSWGCVLSGLCLWGLTAGLGQAQSIGSMVDLKKTYDLPADATRRGKLITGEEQPTAGDNKIAEAAAKFHIYRITHRAPPANVQAEFEKFVSSIELKKEKNARFVNQFLGPAMVVAMKDVLALDMKENPSIVINACMMLPAMAKLNSDAISDYLALLVQDQKTSDVLRLYALRALKEAMPIGVFDPSSVNAGTKEFEAAKARDAKNVDSLAKFIDRPIKLTDPKQVAVAHHLRREAIASLSYAGAPAVAVVKKKAKVDSVQGPVAPTLLKVLDGKGMNPPPSVQEKIDATVGLCAMKYPNMTEYAPQPAVYLVGQALAQILGEYNKDLPNFTAKGKDRKLPMIAWKAEGKRLELGLKDLKANSLDPGAKTNADQLEMMVKPLLLAMQKHDLLDATRKLEFDRLVPQLRPKAGVVFKGLPYDLTLSN